MTVFYNALVRAHGNFAEYVPLGLLFIIALELMHSPSGLLWLLGGTLTFARIVYAWGVIGTYEPSIGRAIGFFATWFVYMVGAYAKRCRRHRVCLLRL